MIWQSQSELRTTTLSPSVKYKVIFLASSNVLINPNSLPQDTLEWFVSSVKLALTR